MREGVAASTVPELGDALPECAPAREAAARAGRIARACPRARGDCQQVRGCARVREADAQYAPVRARAGWSFQTCTRACTPAREDRTMKVERPRLRVEVTPADLDRIAEAIAAGASYSQAAMAAGVRPSALRVLKRAAPAVARRLRLAWQEQGRRLRAVALDDSRQPLG